MSDVQSGGQLHGLLYGRLSRRKALLGARPQESPFQLSATRCRGGAGRRTRATRSPTSLRVSMSRSGNTSPTASSNKPRQIASQPAPRSTSPTMTPATTPARSSQNAQDAITAGVDLIIISPTDSSSAPTVLDLAAENNVPVVIADIGTDEGEYVSFVISTNEQGAYDCRQSADGEDEGDGL